MSEQELIIYGLISYTAVLLAAILGYTIIGWAAFRKTEKGAAKSFSLLFARGDFLRIATVLVVVNAVMYLAMFGKLTQGTVAILSGVAAYVLGGLEKSKGQGSGQELSNNDES